MQYDVQHVVNRIEELEKKIEHKRTEINALEAEREYAATLKEKILKYTDSILDIPDLSELKRERDRLWSEISILQETERPTADRQSRLEVLEAQIELIGGIIRDLKPYQEYYANLARK